MEFQENYNHILKKNHRYMTKVKQAPTHIVPKSTTSKRKSVQKEFNFRFEFLKGDSENINFLNMKIEDFPKDDKKTLVKQQTSKIEKQTTSKFLDKNLMVDDMKSLQTDRININYKFIFQKISDYFMAIHNPEQILFRDEEIKEISEFIAQF